MLAWDNRGTDSVIGCGAILTYNVAMTHPLQATNRGALVSQAQAIVVPCILRDVCGYNASGSLAYVQLHDRSTALSGGEVPLFVIPVPGGRTCFSMSMSLGFDAGITIALSSTEATFTALGSPNLAYAVMVSE
jgi:hypothetical protein